MNSTPRGGWFETALLFGLLCLIPIRAVISETQTFEVPRSIRTLDAPAGPSPATTFLIDAFIFAAAGLTLAAQLWKGRPYRRSGAEWGLAILVVAMIVSTVRAGQKHLAIIGSLDFAAIMVYCITLRQLLVRPWHVRLALTVILATGGMMIAKCGYQKWFEQPETLKYYQEHKGELISANQSSPGFIYDYEQRLKSGAVTGFFPHPNVLASYLLLVIMVSLAVARSRWGNRPVWTLFVPLLVTLSGFVALVGTQSKGAIAALGIGLLFWASARVFRDRVSPRRAVIVIWCLLLAGSAAFAGVLHAKPDALGRSILFRTFYWKAAARMIHDHPLGVGANNFGRWFTRYKDVECPEDVEDPHSWPVRAAAEWGLPGLAGMLVLFLGISWHIARNSRAVQRVPGPGFMVPAPLTSPRTPSIILTSALFALAVFIFWYAILSDASAAFILLTFHIPLIAWFVTSILGGLESTEPPCFMDDAIPSMIAPLVAGLLAFVVHTGIDLAMFTSGPAMVFWEVTAILLACASGKYEEPETSLLTHHRWSPRLIAFCGLLVGAGALYLSARSSLAADSLHQARKRPENSRSMGYHRSSCAQCHNYMSADFWYPYDASALNEHIDSLMPCVQSVEDADYILELANWFRLCDPQSALVPQISAILYLRRFELETAATSQASTLKREILADLDRAIAAAREAIEAYPTNPSRHLFLADLLEKRAANSENATERRHFNSEAAAELQTALDSEAKRIYVSPLHRMDDSTRSIVHDRIKRLTTQWPGT